MGKGELLEDLSLFINKRINFIESFMKKEDRNEIGSKIEPESFVVMKNENTVKDSKIHNKNFIEQINTLKNNVVEEIEHNKKYEISKCNGFKKLADDLED